MFLSLGMSANAAELTSSPYTGTTVQAGTEFYLYNVESGLWLQENNRFPADWNTHGELGTVGFDVELKQINGGWQINPKFGHNESLNASNQYLDTGDAVTAWEFVPIQMEGVSNAYQIKQGGEWLHATPENEGFKLIRNGNEVRATWQIVTREERIRYAKMNATLSNPVDLSFLIRGNEFSYEDTRREANWTLSENDNTNQNWNSGRFDLNVNAENSVFEAWEMTKMNFSQTVTGLPAGYYEVEARASESPTGKDGLNSVDLEKYNNGTLEQYGVLYAGSYSVKLPSVYSEQYSERTGHFAGKELGSTWIIDGPNQFSYAVAKKESAYKVVLKGVKLTSDGNLTLGIKVSDVPSDKKTTWIMADKFRLRYLGSDLSNTLSLAKSEGIEIPASVENKILNGTDAEVEENLRIVRNLRKLNAIEKVDISMIECSEPTNVEADYYLYNVGAGVFFSTTADWGCHIAIDNPGMLIHFRPDGEWSGAAGRPVFHLSGNGWDGMNWEEEYWDKDGNNKLAFVPVEGKEKVYNMCEYDNYNWHFVYDPAEDVCDQNTHYWNSVQKRSSNPADYKGNPYAQWMLVSPEAYKAAMENASETKPLDVTFLINNPNFTKAKVDGNDNWVRGWTGVGDQKRGQNREPWMVIEWYNANADMKQTITGLTPGKYQLSCYGFYRDGSSANEATKVGRGETLLKNAYLVAKTSEHKVFSQLPNVTSEAGKMPGIGETRSGVNGEFVIWPWQANEYFQTGLYKTTAPIINVGSDKELIIGVESNYNGVDGSWIVVGNFRLTYLGPVDEDDNYLPLPVKTGFNVDVVAEGTPVSNYTSETGLDANNAMLYTSDVNTDGGLPADGVVSTLNGNTYFIEYDKPNGVKITDDNPHVLELSDYANAKEIFVLGISANQGSKIQVVANYTDNTSSEPTTLSLKDWYNSNDVNIAVTGLGRFSYRQATDPDGVKLFCLYETSLKTDASKQIKSITLTRTQHDADNTATTILAVSMFGTISKTINLTKGYATFSAGQPYSIETDGVKAYKMVQSTSANSVKMEELTDGIPANTGVVLFGENQSSVSLKTKAASSSDVFGNLMKPNVSDYDLPGSVEIGGTTYYNYTLGMDNGKIAFLRSSGEGTLAAGKAYLQLPASSAARVSIVFEDETTGISSMDNEQSTMNGVYDLQGRKVDDVTKKGLYILNGKKVIK